MKTIQFLVSEEMHKNFKIWCCTNAVTMSEYLRDAIAKTGSDDRQYIVKEMKTRDGFTVRLPVPFMVDGNTIHIPKVSDEQMSILEKIEGWGFTVEPGWELVMPMECRR